MSEPMKPDYSPHGTVVKYDGAFWCLDCSATWGALPGEPSMSMVCVKPAQEGTPLGPVSAELNTFFGRPPHTVFATEKGDMVRLVDQLERQAQAQAKRILRIEELERDLAHLKIVYDGTIRLAQRYRERAEQAERGLADAQQGAVNMARNFAKEAARAEQSEALVEQLQGALRNAYAQCATVCDELAAQCERRRLSAWTSDLDREHKLHAQGARMAAGSIRARSGHAHAPEPKE